MLRALLCACLGVSLLLRESDGVGAHTLLLQRSKGVGDHKTAYFGRVKLGSEPAHELTVLFDTGSGNLMVPGEDCTSAACASHRQYKRGTTGQMLQGDETPVPQDGTPRDTMAVSFGTGQIKGEFVKDRVCVGSLCVNMPFIEATSETDEPFEEYKFDGILGLALPALSESPNFNFVQKLKDSGRLENAVFSVFLADDGPSEVSFGGASKRVASEWLYSPVTGDSGYWQVTLADVAVDHNSLNVGPVAAALDTGTSQIGAPTPIVMAIVEAVDVWANCSNLHELPKIGFVINGHSMDLDPQDYSMQDDNGCSLALMPMDQTDEPLVVLGEPFLRKFVTLYDIDQKRVGFASAMQTDSAPATLVLMQ